MGKKITAKARFAAESLIALLVWCLFVFGWFRVLRMFPASELTASLQLIGSIAVLYGSAITIWVWLRVRRARRAKQIEQAGPARPVGRGHTSMAGAGD